ncbi:sporulation inhibitor of replication protein SirA [Peribacillus simplex]|uniref:Sporulation inhibitor of replication protein SirA n=2 Tax=Peribacillus TaxID=2675229 RepID=A0A9X8ZF47_9BACI|nr:sporulation inhibitor of replication protein SirA [Peribacillus simplex]TKH02690.1 sporulation inhibitor of replication protein SirA [Peribacillus simplex]TKH09121.1 sporulation inhibitor of replication protein SirA [Peribacillus simplex]
MRTYQIYLIEDEFAHHYYGREKLFFNLFLEYIQAKGRLKSILQKQIEYVTKTVPIIQLQLAIEQRLQKKMNYWTQNGKYYLEKTNGSSKAVLIIHNDSITLKAEGDYEAETAFFESIRKYEASFLAIDFEHEKYGWLKPIKERKFV